MSAEENKLMEHEYDGIQEFDNPMPRWWLGLFFLTVVFAFIYFPYYHFFGGKLPRQLFLEESTKIAEIRQVAETKRQEEQKIRQAELAQARKDKAAAMPDSEKGIADPTKTDVVRVSTGTRINWDFEGDVEEGADLFSIHCFTCHGKSGEGLIGPNLTDEFWIHGNRPEDLQKTITNGVLEKGMIAWKTILNSEDIRNVTAYVLSIRFSNPPNPKPPQGTPYPN